MFAHLTRLRESATVAHVLPLAVFMLLNSVPGWFRIENPELPWYRQAPEHWLYPVQTLLTGGLLIFFARHYRLAPWRGLGGGAVLGLVGIALWVAPAWLYERLVTSGTPLPGWAEWLGVAERKEGFDPEVLSSWPAWQWASIGMRFVRMVVVVPLIEEIFWRGFLMRYVGAGERDWQQVPFGLHSWRVFGVVTLLVMLAHNPVDYLGAFVWGSLMYFVAVRTKSLGACVFMHAVGNLALGLYVCQTRQWGFW
ncbi:MAG: CAAX prenyl protease-related protein [Verrucomicrobiota bacterium]